jgi:hypothetical protein
MVFRISRVKSTFALLALAITILISGCTDSAHQKYKEMHKKHHGESSDHVSAEGHQPGMHDTDTMPGLRGENASQAESDEIATLFRNFETITREVTNLQNGIKTVTRSSDTDVMNVLISHSTSMIDLFN